MTATFTGVDATSGPATQSASETTAAGAEGADIEVRSPVFSDTAGNSSALGAVIQRFRIDGTAPAVAYSEADREPNAKGWYNAPVTATFTGTDAVSGPAVATQTATSAGEGASVVVGSPVFADLAGNASEAGTPSASYKIDLTAPSVSFTSLSGTEGTNGWYTGPVTATFTGTDALSGPESAVKTTVSSGEGTGMVLASPAFTDDADNTTPAGAVSSTAFKVDLTDPVASFDSVLADAYFRSLGARAHVHRHGCRFRTGQLRGDRLLCGSGHPHVDGHGHRQCGAHVRRYTDLHGESLGAQGLLPAHRHGRRPQHSEGG